MCATCSLSQRALLRTDQQASCPSTAQAAQFKERLAGASVGVCACSGRQQAKRLAAADSVWVRTDGSKQGSPAAAGGVRARAAASKGDLLRQAVCLCMGLKGPACTTCCTASACALSSMCAQPVWHRLHLLAAPGWLCGCSSGLCSRRTAQWHSLLFVGLIVHARCCFLVCSVSV